MAGRSRNLLCLLAATAILITGAGLRSRESAAEAPSPTPTTPGTRSPATPAPGTPVPGTLAPGSRAPLFSARKLDGGTLALASLRGQVVLLNFWAPACPPCRIEMPELEKIHRRYADRGLRVIGITEMDPSREQVLGALKEVVVTYPVLLDPGARVGSLYAIVAHPTSVLIDARGIVRYVNVGYLRGEEKDIEQAILQALRPRRTRSAGTRSPDARDGGP